MNGEIHLAFAIFAYILVYVAQCTNAVKQNGSKTTPQPAVPDPIVALEGQCIVVCDASKVAVEPEQPEAADPSSAGVEDRVTTKLWDKMQSSCGDLVSLNRRSKKVAFSVVRNSGLSTTDHNPILVFDYILVNVGGGFDTAKSVFIAPVSGVYSFSFQVFRIFNKSPLYVDLKVRYRINYLNFNVEVLIEYIVDMLINYLLKR